MQSKTIKAEKTKDNDLIVLKGATAHVGGRLLKVLEERRLRVRCLARCPKFLGERVHPETEVLQGEWN